MSGKSLWLAVVISAAVFQNKSAVPSIRPCRVQYQWMDILVWDLNPPVGRQVVFNKLWKNATLTIHASEKVWLMPKWTRRCLHELSPCAYGRLRRDFTWSWSAKSDLHCLIWCCWPPPPPPLSLSLSLSLGSEQQLASTKSQLKTQTGNFAVLTLQNGNTLSRLYFSKIWTPPFCLFLFFCSNYWSHFSWETAIQRHRYS